MKRSSVAWLASRSADNRSGGTSIAPAERSPASSTVTLPALTANIRIEPPVRITPERDEECGQRHRLRQQHADHGGDGLRQVIEAQQIERIAADDERDEHQPADDRNRDQGLEQRVGDELDEHDLPIRGRDQGAAFQGELQQSSHSTMTVRMTFPSFVTRAALRIALGGLVAAAAIAVAALVIERTQLGGDLAASRARLRAEVEGEFAALAGRLDQAVRAVTLDAETCAGPSRAMRRPRGSCSIRSRPAPRAPDVAVTIYGAANQPVAWLGRSEDVPDARLTGPRRRSWRKAARACSWSACSRCSIRPIPRGTSARWSRRRRCRGSTARRCPARSSRSRPASCRSRCGCSSKARRMPARTRS